MEYKDPLLDTRVKSKMNNVKHRCRYYLICHPRRLWQ